MPLSIAERKHRMGYGQQRAVAAELHLSEGYVSSVMNGDVRPKTEPAKARLRETQEALAAKLGIPVTEAFAEALPETIQEVAPALAHTS